MSKRPLLRIKDHPELRHVLSHLHGAIDAMARGERETAQYELESIEGLIFFEDDDEMTQYLKGAADGITSILTPAQAVEEQSNSAA